MESPLLMRHAAMIGLRGFTDVSGPLAAAHTYIKGLKTESAAVHGRLLEMFELAAAWLGCDAANVTSGEVLEATQCIVELVLHNSEEARAGLMRDFDIAHSFVDAWRALATCN